MSDPILTIDFETRSPVDLKKTGVDVYAKDDDTDVWCAAWAIDNKPVQLWRMGDKPQAQLEDHVLSGGKLAAWNANFEIAIWTSILWPRYDWPLPKVEQWRCTMAAAYAMALPGALENAAGAVGLDLGKDLSGKRLMLAMSRPRRRRKGESDTGQLLWRDGPEDLEKLYAYCKQDVEVERAIRERIVALRPAEQSLWHLDHRINTRGVPVDEEYCRKALAIVEEHAKRLDRRMQHLTDYEVSACSNVNQLKTWLKSKDVVLGEVLNKKTMQFAETLNKETVNEILARQSLSPECREALELRQEAGKASVSKIDALLNGMSSDGRARGLCQYHAASTGRWGGRRFQPQNIVRPDEKFDVNGAIDTIMNYPTSKALDLLDAMYGPPLTCVSYTLRGMIKAPKGKKIVAADFSNIEGRVLAWLAGERSKVKAFEAFDAGTGPDIYLVAAAGIYGVPIETLNKKSPERQIGKVSELACGFGGGVGAFQTMAHTYGVKVPDSQAEEIKSAWRDANPNIKQFWYDLDEAAITAVYHPGRTVRCGPVAFKVVGSFLWLQLPSGRALCYPYPKVMNLPTPWGQQKDMLTFKTLPNVSNARKIIHEDKTNTPRWARISTYGGSLAENVTQAVARDVLAEAMVRLEAEGYPVILTVHDEAVSEVDEGFGSASEYEAIMSVLPAWAKGLPVAASGFESERYRK